MNAITSSRPLALRPLSTLPLSTLGWLLLAGATMATFDLAFAIGWWALRDVEPIRIFQAIAAWALGRETAFSGGMATALFGAALQFCIMTTMATAYHYASRRYPRLLLQPVRWGALYGGLLYVLQFLVVLPLFSAADPPRTVQVDWMLACFVVYVLLVGIPCALFARAAPTGHE